MQAIAKKGDRIKLLAMPDDPAPLPVGATGTIEAIWENSDFVQYRVNWDAPNKNRSILVIQPPDLFEVVT